MKYYYSVKLMNRCANELRYFLTILVWSAEELIGEDNRPSKYVRFGIV